MVNKQIRKTILQTAFNAGQGHVASAFSIVEILYSLYFDVMKKCDKFILSKGHGCLALYAILKEKGYLSQEQLDTFSKYDSSLGGHPHKNKSPYFEASTGSLGHGLPLAVGICLAKKIQGRCGRTFCLIGDGECNEGTTWESALLANNLKLDSLVCIVDDNGSQSRAIPTNNIVDKFKSFGWDAYEVDGHDLDSLKMALNDVSDGPLCIVAKTVKGSGIKTIENSMFEWHHKAPNEEQLKDFIKELDS